jgi:carboxyl-terminal processing protease
MSKFIKFMSSKNSFPVYIILLVGISFFAFRGIKFSSPKAHHTVMVNGMELPESEGIETKIVPNQYEKIIRNVMLVLEELHYNPKKVDDVFSKQIFTDYLEGLDASKDILLLSDINDLRKKFENKIDDELKLEVKADFFGTAGEVYKKRLEEIGSYMDEFLSKPFDFTVQENIQLDPKKIEFPKDAAQRKDYWRKKLKFMTLERYNDLLNQNETAKQKKTNAALEKEAREKVLKIIKRNYEGMKKKTTKDDFFKMFMNVVTQAYDPHTDYMPPVDQRSFNEEMSGVYFGIGAQLREEDGNIKIGPLTAGSPADKSGELTVGDMLIAVAQGADEPVDVAGFAIPECVKIIRGKLDTEVRLTLKKADGTIKVVKLIRKKLNLEGTFAKSTIIQDGNQKVGVIYLPEFYADFNDPNGPRCSKDVAKEIEKLKAENVNGIIMDLRNNGGGSLYDVVQMVGYFIEEGPVVQVKDRRGDISTQKDKDRSVLWDGPLTVMVNEFSASASEIFAAAIQDYNRGIVIGSTSTFGKGTVQRQIPLNFENNKLLETDEYGSIKVTLQKFYRVSGGSTQLKGVTPDIQLPDVYEYLKYREKDNVSALSWDEISKAKYANYGSLNLVEVKKASANRISKNAAFNMIKTNTTILSKDVDKEYSLNLEAYKKEQLTVKNLNKQMDEVLKVRDSLPASYLAADKDKFYNVDKDKLENNKNFLKSVSRDIYLNEAVKIIGDMIRTKAVAVNK